MSCRPAAGDRPLVTVVIPHLDDLLRLDACLDRLETQSLPREQFEIVVADNGSACGLAEVERVVGGRGRVALAPERGAGPARNAGVAAARGEVLAFTDADCEPDADWLRCGLEGLRPGSFLGGAVVVTGADPQRPTPAEAFELVYAFRIEHYARSLGFVASCNLFVAASDFARVGGFLTQVSEDTEWCRRATLRGLTLFFDPHTVMIHPARADWPALCRKTDRVTRELHQLWRAEGRPIWLWRARALAMVASPLAQGWAVLGSRRLPTSRSMLEALCVLVALKLRRAAHMLRLASNAAA